jgi:SAM-dependent methyltransferase
MGPVSPKLTVRAAGLAVGRDRMHVNYRYCLAAAEAHGGRVLDFGCGAGATVREGLKQGLDIWGADVFFDASPEYLTAVQDLLGDRVFRIENDRLPFADDSFDMVVSNQVFEHVPELGKAIAEIARVLKPGGKLVTLFPTLEVWIEAHCRIPFAHRLVRWPWLFRPYMSLAHRLGFGNERANKTRAAWVAGFERYLPESTAYRRLPEIRRILAAAGLKPRHREAEYMRFRWGRPLMPPILFRRLAGVVIEAEA